MTKKKLYKAIYVYAFMTTIFPVIEPGDTLEIRSSSGIDVYVVDNILNVTNDYIEFSTKNDVVFRKVYVRDFMNDSSPSHWKILESNIYSSSSEDDFEDKMRDKMLELFDSYLEEFKERRNLRSFPVHESDDDESISSLSPYHRPPRKYNILFVLSIVLNIFVVCKYCNLWDLLYKLFYR